MSLPDLRNVTLGQLAEIFGVNAAAEPSTWIDIRSDESPVPYRQALAAAQRGELVVHKIGRRGLVKRAELDAWIATQPKIGDEDVEAAPAESAAAKILERNGWRRAG